MEANYVGPGWYWVEGTNQPLFLFSKNGRLTSMVYVENIGVCESTTSCGEPFKIITHIPRPIARPVVDWSVMPAWAKWVAMDKNGKWFWYTEEPYTEEACDATRWYPGGRSVFFDGHGEIPPRHKPTYIGDWRNSLVERP